MRFYVNKTLFEIKYSFLLIIAFSMLSRSYDYLFILLFSALHELGHILCLYLFNGKANKIVFAYYGIGLEHNESFVFIKELVFLFSGVVVNIIFTLINIKREINISLAFINLLPIYPLDCGRAFKLVLNNLFRLNISDLLYKLVSTIVIILLICFAIYTKSLSLGLIIIYVIVYALNNGAL